ncbi:MAG: methyl-accepting chemotaxis protein [Methanomicrobiales archaeon HGW-Methanomicrobiales-4]|nr:MAG: methyl-accepting chemotaxis protein [Methanomicrobiales archaeon HGW-Methanomicrobiales-4]
MDFLDNIQIGRKLIASFLIIAIILGIVAVIGYSNMKTINDGMTSMYFDRLIPIQDIGNAETSFYQLRGDLYKYIAIPDQRASFKQTFVSEKKVVNDMFDKYRATSLLDSEIAELKNWDVAWANYQTLFDDAVTRIDEGKEKEVVDSLGAGAMADSRKAVGDSLDRLQEINRVEAERINTESDLIFTASILMLTLAGIIGVIIALVLGFVISRSITIPLNKGVTMMQEMSLGHLNNRLNMGRKDEIGVLARAMDSFANDLQNVVIGGLKEIARGNLSITVPPRDDLDEISPAMITMLEALRGLVSEAKMLSQAAVEGKLSTRGDADRFQGGYREVVEGVNATLDSVINPVNEAMRLSGSYAKGNYTDRISDQLSVKGDFITFKEALNQIGIQGSIAIGGVKSEIESLTGGMEETNASAEEVAGSTGMLAQNAATVSSLAERSGNGIKQSLSAMEDLSQTVSAVASKAEQASVLAKQTVDLSEKGVTLAGKAEKGMEGIMHSVDETSIIITDITSQMEEIGKIVDVISGIADQTGLLALNAAIEAARAGDAGMGFAVVADEVKSLALESQKSTENIATIIGNLQKKSHLVSESMKVSSTEVKAGNTAVSETLQVFNQIVEAINQVNNNMTEVAGATQEQAAAVEEITASVHEVDSIIEETAQEAVSSAAATEEINAAIDQVTHAITEASSSIQRISIEMGKFTVS